MNRTLPAALATILILGQPAGAGLKRTPRQTDAIDQRLLWSYECAGPVIYMQLYPNGVLHLLCRVGKRKKYKLQRILLNRNGKAFWAGDAEESVLIAGNPRPILLTVSNNKFALRSLNKSGQILWEAPLGGLPGGIIVDGKQGMVAVYTASGGAIGKSRQSRMHSVSAFALDSGRRLWSRELGDQPTSIETLGAGLHIDSDGVWVAGPASAALLERATGILRWDAKLPRHGSPGAWWPVQGGAIWSSKGQLVAFDRRNGRLWQKAPVKPKQALFDKISESDGGLIAGFWTSGRVTLVRLDPQTGAEIWRAVGKQGKNMGPPPLGFGVANGRVVAAANRSLLAFDVDTGRRMYERKVDKKLYPFYRELRQRGERTFLIGDTGVEAFHSSSGQQVWRQAGYQTAQGFFEKTNQLVAAVSATMVQSMLGSHSPMAQVHRSRAKSASNAGEYRLWMDQAYQAEAAAGRRARKRLEEGLGAIGSRVRPPLKTVNSQGNTRFVQLSRLLNTNRLTSGAGYEVDVVVLDLATQKTTLSPVAGSTFACASRILADTRYKRIIQAHRQMGLGCKNDTRVNAYKF